MSLDAAEIGKMAGEDRTAAGGAFGRMSKQTLIALVLLFDLSAIAASGVATAVNRLGLPLGDMSLPLALILGQSLLLPLIFQRLWAYTVPSLGSMSRQGRALLLGLTGGFGLMMGCLFLAKVDVMAFRGWMILWFAASLAALVLFRVLIVRAVNEAAATGQLARRAVIIGGGKATEDLIQRLEKSGPNAIRILGTFDDRGDARSPSVVGRYRKIGTFAELEHYCRAERVDLLVVALPASAEDRILHLMKSLWALPVDVRIAAHAARLKLHKRSYSFIGDVPFLGVFDRPLSDVDAATKAVFDRVVAALALLLLSPLMMLTALAVRLESKGPILFRQVRLGFNNEPIGVFKFRSMHVEMSDADGARQVTKDDPRVTRVGRFIRKTSIDELPQLINVLRGELSLVGPRPHAVQSKAGNRLYQEVVDGYYARHRMKPGITGWAQVNGWRGGTDTAEKLERRVEHDLHYIENWSLAFDCYILAITPFSLLDTRNAY